MISEDMLQALQTMDFTRGMSLVHLEKLASMASEVEYPKGKILYRAGDIGQTIYLIETGEVAIETEVPGYGPVTTVTVGPGHLLGWSALYPGRRKAASARVVSPVRAVAINAARLRDACKADHSLETIVINNVGEVIADRLRATRERLAEALVTPQPKPHH